MDLRLARMMLESAGQSMTEPALLAVADVDGRHAGGRGLQDATRGIADDGIRQPQRGPVAFAAQRGEEIGAVRPRSDESTDGVVNRTITGIGVDTGEDDGAVL